MRENIYFSKRFHVFFPVFHSRNREREQDDCLTPTCVLHHILDLCFLSFEWEPLKHRSCWFLVQFRRHDVVRERRPAGCCRVCLCPHFTQWVYDVLLNLDSYVFNVFVSYQCHLVSILYLHSFHFIFLLLLYPVFLHIFTKKATLWFIIFFLF